MYINTYLKATKPLSLKRALRTYYNSIFLRIVPQHHGMDASYRACRTSYVNKLRINKALVLRVRSTQEQQALTRAYVLRLFRILPLWKRLKMVPQDQDFHFSYPTIFFKYRQQTWYVPTVMSILLYFWYGYGHDLELIQ